MRFRRSLRRLAVVYSYTNGTVTDLSPQFQPVFARLRDVLQKNAGTFHVGRNTTDHYSLNAPVGPATLRAWGGKVKRPTIPVA